MYSISWNGQSLTTYGVLVKSHALSLARTYDSMQCQDRSWAGKGQGAPCVMTLDIYITGASQAQCEERYWNVRGLLDQEDECVLKLDRFGDRYWMAKFDSLSPLTFVGKNVVSATLIFTCHDRAAYATAASTQTETLTENVSALYGGVALEVCFDDDFVYVAGGTTRKAFKLSKVDLTKISEGPVYGGDIMTVCCDSSSTGYIYYGGDGGAGQYDVVKLDKATMAVEVRGPDYGGIIYSCVEYGNYIYYGGATTRTIKKLLKSDMTTVAATSPSYGGQIEKVIANDSHVFAAGQTTKRVRRYLITDLTYVDQSDDYGGTIFNLAIDSTNIYCCGGAGTVWKIPLADLTAETASVDLGFDLYAIAVDSLFIYTAGQDDIVRKLLISDMSLVANSETCLGDIYCLAIDTVNNWLFLSNEVQTVWKLDTRHLPEVLVGTNTHGQRALCADDDFVYIAGGDINRVSKLDKKTLTIMAESPVYTGGAISAICESGDYVYCGGFGGYVYKLQKEGLILTEIIGPYRVLMDPANILCMCTNGTNIYVGGDANVATMFSCAGGASAAESANYGGAIYAIDVDASNVYIGGDTLQKLRTLHLTTLVTVATAADDYGGTIRSILATDGLTLYMGGATGTVWAVTKVGLVHTLTSADFGTLANYIQVNSLYLYVISSANLYKLLLADLTTIAYAAYHGAGMSAEEGYIYCSLNTTTAYPPVYKLDNRVMWKRSDHEITITSAGTAKCGLDFASTASQANYWQQAYENQTSGDEFDWEGSQASGEELEVDSELWYCTLEGASAMSGMSGDFLTLSPGANVLYLENVTGVVVFDWTDRFA